jgi:dihydropteroate synthase
MVRPDNFRIGKQELTLGARTYVMGVLNVTPDSFSDGGRHFTPDEALSHAETMIRDGVDIIDIGGESSRPAGPYGDGAAIVPAEEETRRTAPVIEAIARRFDTPMSIDTVKHEVARRAIDAGAHAVNDIGGFTQPEMVSLVADAQVSAFVMHMKGKPANMQKSPDYKDLIGELKAFLGEAVRRLLDAGVATDRIAIDPGLGFGKSYDDNYEIIRRLAEFANLGQPILIGPSRKTFVGLDYALPPDDREEGSLAAITLCAAAGAHILRVHDVRAARRALFVADRLGSPRPGR